MFEPEAGAATTVAPAFPRRMTMISSIQPRGTLTRNVFKLLICIAIAGSAGLASCNTTEGVGKDVKSLGKGIEETAQDAKD